MLVVRLSETVGAVLIERWDGLIGDPACTDGERNLRFGFDLIGPLWGSDASDAIRRTSGDGPGAGEPGSSGGSPLIRALMRVRGKADCGRTALTLEYKSGQSPKG
jgi:hypothetical protein